VLLFLSANFMLLFMAFQIDSNLGELESTKFKERFGDTLTEGLTLRGWLGTYWHIIMLARGSVTCVLLVCAPLAF